MGEPVVIHFEPALPCTNRWANEQGELVQCGKPARVANVFRERLGEYVMMPICRECVARMQSIRNYQD